MEREEGGVFDDSEGSRWYPALPQTTIKKAWLSVVERYHLLIND